MAIKTSQILENNLERTYFIFQGIQIALKS